MYLHVFLRRPNVDPIPAGDVRDERLASFNERRKEAPLDRPSGVLGYPIEGVRFEHVYAGINRVAGNFIRLRLFEESLNIATGVGFDQPVCAGILDWREYDGRLG